jgi:two-component system NtrC family sensor kinase
VKKKLILGLGLITLIFIISGVFILHNLNVITSNHELKEQQEEIISRYNSILIDLKGAQAELYRHQAGYTRDINILVDSVLQLEETLTLTKNDYTKLIGRASCDRCHLARGKFNTIMPMFEEIELLLKKYKARISRIVTLSDFELSRALEADATQDGDAIIEKMTTIQHAALKMNEMMEAFQVTAIKKATYSIIAAIVISVLLSIVIVAVIMRSITGPVLKLVKGIENVASGRYDAKVDIVSRDEIGFLAETFNTMTDNLNRTTRQKESLMLELRDLNSDLERRIEEAREELRITHENMLRSETLSVVGTFASGVAHELATPISTIISYFGMIKGRLSAQDTEDADIIESELHRCRNILRGMLNFARTPEKDKSLTDVNSIIRDILALVKYQTEYRKIVISEDLADNLPGIMAVPGQLRQVFMNIIVNALQSMSSRGELNVSTSAEGDGGNIVIRISDTGCGIPENEINKIFNPFYTSKESGTGLGLSISYGMIKGHGGEIEVQSEQGKGTTFTISLPVT